jgi:hypothetical protein
MNSKYQIPCLRRSSFAQAGKYQMSFKAQIPVTQPFRADHNQGQSLELQYLGFGFDLTFELWHLTL